jgi:hypothetical protein
MNKHMRGLIQHLDAMKLEYNSDSDPYRRRYVMKSIRERCRADTSLAVLGRASGLWPADCRYIGPAAKAIVKEERGSVKGIAKHHLYDRRTYIGCWLAGKIATITMVKFLSAEFQCAVTEEEHRLIKVNKLPRVWDQKEHKQVWTKTITHCL